MKDDKDILRMMILDALEVKIVSESEDDDTEIVRVDF